MIDTHCHLTFSQLRDRLDDVLAGAAEDGVDRMITVGVTPDDAETARAIAADHANVRFTVGFHPHYAAELKEGDVDRLVELAADERCAAFGEMGLDYHYPDPPRDLQRRVFEQALGAVGDADIDKPIIIHNRKATDDTIAMIRASGVDPARFVFHCFTEPAEDADKVLDLGAMLSFTGIVTYKNAPEVRESALRVPDDRIMVETDAPFLTPAPHRKIRPNEPRYVAVTVRFLAELRDSKHEDFIRRCDRNAEGFFASLTS